MIDARGVLLPPAALDAVLPLHVVVGMDGRLRHAAPTFQKICPDPAAVGRLFFDLIEVERPLSLVEVDDLAALVGARLKLRFRGGDAASLKGLVVPLGPQEGFLVDLSFGISVVSAVADHGLTGADFAHSDQTIEMLYLAEANAAAMEEARRLIHRLENSRNAAQTAALTDGLTGAGNRRALDAWVAARLRTGAPFALLQADLDFFKTVNDTHGHATGDEVLRIAAKRIRRELRDTDRLARVGGDEFVILADIGMARAPGRNLKLEDLGKRLVAALERPIHVGRATCRISVSIGASLSTRFPEPNLETMLEDADDALYAVKRSGRGRALIKQG